MRKVYRYVLDKRIKELEVPYGAIILKAGLRRNEEVCVWMEVTIDEDGSEPETEKMIFHQIRTNETIPAEANYVDTVEIEDTDFIYHIYVEFLG